MNYLKTIFKNEWVVPFLILCTGILFFPLKGVNLSPDSSWYLNNALKIYQDFSVDELWIRRPLFHILLALSFKLFGVSVESAFYVVRFFYVSNLLLSYAVGTKLFSRTTGILFFLLILTSYEINYWSSRLLLDNVIVFFLLLFTLLTFLAFERSSYLIFTVSGIALAGAILTKGVVAVFFIPLPALMIFINANLKSSRNLIGIAVLYVSSFIVLSPWITAILIYGEESKILLGPLVHTDKLRNRGFIPQLSNPLSFDLILSIISNKASEFCIVLHTYIINPFTVWPFFAAGLSFSIFKAVFKKDEKHRVLIIIIFLFSPIFYVAMNAKGLSFRLGQFLLLYFLLYLMASECVIQGVKLATSSISIEQSSKNKLRLFLTIVVISLFVSIQIFYSHGCKKNFSYFFEHSNSKKHRLNSFAFYKGDIKLGGWFNSTVLEASNWLEHNITPGEKIFCQWHYFHSLDFITKQNFNFITIEDAAKDDNSEKFIYAFKKIIQIPSEYELLMLGRPLFLQLNYQMVKKIIRGRGIKALFENDLLNIINEHSAKYIIVTYRRNYLSLYLNKNVSFKTIKSFDGGKIKIYEILDRHAKPLGDSFTVRFVGDFFHTLRLLFKKEPSRYEQEKNIISSIIKKTSLDPEYLFNLIEKNENEIFHNYILGVQERTIY